MEKTIEELENRKGAKNRDEVPKQIKILLNEGKIETVNLIESLVVNQEKLLKNVLSDLNMIDIDDYLKPVINELNSLKKKTYPKSIIIIGQILLDISNKKNDSKLFEKLSKHKSDIVRSWACFFVGHNENLSLNEKFELIKPFANDKHHSVREYAWMAMRDEISKNLKKSIAILAKWTKMETNFRRFASEATRPRGVWTNHINKLKESPEMALAILEPLKSDKEKYVQNSVGNWLNDASKSKGEWVKTICNRWIKESPTKETEKIIKRGLRTISKK
ncbi:MAG: DNA alkylation repair protein [Methanobrevibacter sp.]|nr:DNA alkylation repair protein [Candidatus Methanoflexus mossambicus]